MKIALDHIRDEVKAGRLPNPEDEKHELVLIRKDPKKEAKVNVTIKRKDCDDN
jgi:hypothetical protein